MQAPTEVSQRGVGEVFSLDILSHRMSVNASTDALSPGAKRCFTLRLPWNGSRFRGVGEQ
jgi:hypothetical protein